MKKIFALFALMLLCIGQMFAYDFEVDGIYYNKSGSNATVTYKTSSYNSYSGIVIIPATVTYDGVTYSVTSVGLCAFGECSSLTSVTIPSSVTSIENSSFYGCSSLTSLTIPSSVTNIDDNAFTRCSGLTSITVASGNTKYDSRDNCNGIIETATNTLIRGCKNTSIPNSVTSIGKNAFDGCSGLTSITIPSSVTSIGKYAFRSCSGLTSITVTSSNTKYDSRDNCNALIETATNTLLFGCKNTTIPSNVTSIGAQAFFGCSSMPSVTIPSSVTSIGSSAFEGCSGLMSVTIPSSVTSIENRSFFDCSSLTSVTIPSSVTSVGDQAFQNCSGLPSLTIPSSMTRIGAQAFFGCSGLTSVTIPSSATSIGRSAFDGCSGLTSVTNLATIPQTISSHTFSKYGTLHVTKGYKDVFAAAPYWGKFTIVDDVSDYSNIPINDGVSYTSVSNYTYDELIYTRTFTSTNWQALYVPFSMKYDDWKDKLDVYDIYNVLAYDEDNNGEIERTTVNMIRLKEGAVTEPNYPYVVRAKNAGDVEITLTDGTLYAAEENSIDCTSTKQKFTFTGTYEPMTGLATKGYYALSGGELKTAIDDAVTLKPQRWYMEVTNRIGSPAAATRVYLNPFGEENEVEGIKGVAVNVIGEETIYDLNGRAVNAAQLPKGLYVRGGKKIIVK